MVDFFLFFQSPTNTLWVFCFLFFVFFLTLKTQYLYLRNNTYTYGTRLTLTEQYLYLRNNNYTYGTILILTEHYLYLRNNAEMARDKAKDRTFTLTEQYLYLRNNTYTYGTIQRWRGTRQKIASTITLVWLLVRYKYCSVSVSIVP